MSGESKALPAKAWIARRLGDPTEALELGEVTVAPPGPNEIRVEVRAFCLNFNDIDIIRGRYATIPAQPPFVPGMEVVGRVESAGTGAESRVGRRVVAIPNGALGGYASFAVAPAATALPVPERLSDAEAAAIHYPFHLGWLALFERAKLTRGETLLVHAAAGGIGSGVLQLGKVAGAYVIATAGTEEKLELCRSLGADLAVNYRTEDIVEATMEATHGRGVDVAFDTVGGQVTQQTFRCMAFNGRHIIAGFASGIEQEDEGALSPRAICYGNFSLVGACHVYVDDPIEFRRMTGLNFSAKADGQRTHSEILRLQEQGRIRPVIGRELDFVEIPEALEAMARRETTGRLVTHVAG